MALWVYRAAAGSGKTFTLVREYLRLALGARDVDGFKHILAVTFTNKAAGEMKIRVFEALAEFAGKSESERFGVMFKQLQESLGLDEAALRNRAEQVLTVMLHRYQLLSIGTIDSFVARLSRQFANELLLDQQFEVLLDTPMLLTQSVENLLERLGNEAALTEILTDLAMEQMEQDKSWQIRQELQKFALQLLRDDMREILPALRNADPARFKQERHALRKRSQVLSDTFAQPAQQLLETLQKADILPSEMYFGGKGYLKAWKECAAGTLTSFTETYDKTIQNQKWVAGKVRPASKAWLEENAAWLSDQSAKIRQAHDACAEELTLVRAILKRQYASATLSLLQTELENWMKEQGAVPLPVLYFRLADLIADSATPYIFERLGNLYRHFLIDEFQDTSVLQWNNLLPLVENGLAGNHDSLLVGDAKQSIYRWRSGDANQFVQLPQQRDGSPGSALITAAYSPRQLNANFRSYKEVIDFNNRFFRFCVDQSAQRIQDFYAGLEQKGGKIGGLVHVKLLEALEKGQRKEAQRQQEVLRLVEQLREQGVPYGEIAVLVRKNAMGSSIAEALIAANVPVISGESLLLQRQPIIRLFWVCFRWLLQPQDTLNLQEGKMLLAQLHHLDTASDESFFDMIGRIYGKSLPAWEWKQLPLNELPEQIFHFFGLLQNSNAYVLRLLDVLREQASKWLQAAELLRWWDTKGGEVALPMPEKGDAVRIMTYHKSKGLEFGVVIVADADIRKNELSQEAVWVKTDMTSSGMAWVSTSDLKAAAQPYKLLYQVENEMTQLDYLNTLYVAFTRAVGALYILGTLDKVVEFSFSNRFQQFAQAQGWEGKDFFEVGSLPHFEQRESAQQQSITHHFWSDWRKRFELQHRFDGSKEVHEALSLGNVAHAILAELSHQKALESLIEAKLQAGEITPNQVDVLLPALRELLNDERLQPYFDESAIVHNEISILGTNGTVHRPDRLVFLPEEVIVLEFKTGQPRPEHQQQLNGYIELLETMGYHTRGELIYLTLNQ